MSSTAISDVKNTHSGSIVANELVTNESVAEDNCNSDVNGERGRSSRLNE